MCFFTLTDLRLGFKSSMMSSRASTKSRQNAPGFVEATIPPNGARRLKNVVSVGVVLLSARYFRLVLFYYLQADIFFSFFRRLFF